MELRPSTVLVTGAFGSLGPSVTNRLLDRGATLIGTVRSDTERVDADDPDAISSCEVDLTDQEAVDAFADTVADEHGSVDHLVGLAGGSSTGGVPNTDADGSGWTAPESVVGEVEHLLTNEGVRGQVIRMTGGRLEVAA